MKRGRKPVLDGEYQTLVLKFKEVGLAAPSFEDYRKAPPAVREALKGLLERLRRPKLPESFTIVGEWISCLVLSDGKTVHVHGKGLEVRGLGDEDAHS